MSHLLDASYSNNCNFVQDSLKHSLSILVSQSVLENEHSVFKDTLLYRHHTDSVGKMENEVNRINLVNCLET